MIKYIRGIYVDDFSIGAGSGSKNEGADMRSEHEMYNLILEVAKNDARIKAVYMNGSRTNENVPKDIFQDYDRLCCGRYRKLYRGQRLDQGFRRNSVYAVS